MIIGYARVSTQDQNPEFQVDALEKALCEQIFQEKFTGKLRERPELAQCLGTLRKGDVLVVWKLDRLAWSLKDLVEIVQDLNDREVGFKSLTEAIDTTSSGGRLVFHIFGALAEFEHDLIREQTDDGLCFYRPSKALCGGDRANCRPADCNNSFMPTTGKKRTLIWRKEMNNRLIKFFKNQSLKVAHLTARNEEIDKLLEQLIVVGE